MGCVSRRQVATWAVGSFATSAYCATAKEGGWPQRLIKLVVPFPPGGGADFAARTISLPMAEMLGQPIIIDQRPGAGTSIGSSAVAKAAPDGYTLLQVNRDMAISPSVYADLDYDTMSSFSWVGKAAEGPYVLAVNAALPIRSLRDVVDYAKIHRLTYAGIGIGGLAHLNTEGLKEHLGIDLLHVPYKGAGPAVAATVAGETAMTLVAVTGALPFIESGKLRALLVGSNARSPLLPHVPTAAELTGDPELILPTYYGIAAPAGTSPEILDLLTMALKRAIDDPMVVRKLIANGLLPAFAPPAELRNTMSTDLVNFAARVKKAGISFQ